MKNRLRLVALLAAACASCTCGCICSAILAVAAISSPGLLSGRRTAPPVPDAPAQAVPAEPGGPDAVARWPDARMEQPEDSRRRRLAELGQTDASGSPEPAGTPDPAPASEPEEPSADIVEDIPER